MIRDLKDLMRTEKIGEQDPEEMQYNTHRDMPYDDADMRTAKMLKINKDLKSGGWDLTPDQPTLGPDQPTLGPEMSTGMILKQIIDEAEKAQLTGINADQPQRGETQSSGLPMPTRTPFPIDELMKYHSDEEESPIDELMKYDSDEEESPKRFLGTKSKMMKK